MPSNPDPQPDPVEKSLGDQATGADVSRVDRDMSLGDQSTTGDALSSMSDLSDLSDDLGDEMPIVDLSERYEIQDVLGKGGMGEVLRALDTRLKRPVAIKRVLGEMARSKKALSRFLTEAQSVAALNHFNIVQIHDYGRDAEGPFIIMELVEGESLLDKLKAGPLEIEEAVDITCQLCDALGKAHGAGIIHRDIKPANILLTEEGTPKLTDFGLARQQTADHGQTQAGAVLGTIDFMPPEQRRDVTATDARSDLWSLAATLYQMLTGEVPRVIDLDAVPQNLRSTFTRALKQDPDERYSTAEEFKVELRKGLATVATVVAADLAAGICPACNTSNDEGRKFCRGCGKSLQLQCLQCKVTMPVWEVFCGACGTNQQEFQQSLQSRFDGIVQQAEQQFSELKFDTALDLLAPVIECDHEFVAETIKRAKTLAARITAEQQQQQQLIDQSQQLAAQYRQDYEFVKALRELNKIPQPLQTRAIKEQVKEIQQVRSEVHTLRSQIKDAIQKRQMQGLLALTTRYLELHPVHEKIAQIHQELLAREGQHPITKRQIPEAETVEATAGIQIKASEGSVASRIRDKKKQQWAWIGGAVVAIVIGVNVLKVILPMMQGGTSESKTLPSPFPSIPSHKEFVGTWDVIYYKGSGKINRKRPIQLESAGTCSVDGSPGTWTYRQALIDSLWGVEIVITVQGESEFYGIPSNLHSQNSFRSMAPNSKREEQWTRRGSAP